MYSQQLSCDPVISSSRNDVAGNGSPESQQQLPYHDMIPDHRNHVAANGSPESQQQATTKSGHDSLSRKSLWQEMAPGNSQTLLKYDTISRSANHIAVNASPQQLLPNQNLELVPNSGLMLPRSQNLDFGSMYIITENTSDTQPLLLEEFNAGRSYSGLNNAASSTLQSPVYSGQGSSYSNCSNSGGDSLNSQFGSGQVNYPISLQRDFQNKYSVQETRGTPIPHFNSSKPDRGVHVKDINGMAIEAWENEVAEDDIR
ncbi:NAC domain containing protein [Melia azedarach]|uniref:NAC domain containing protein n=1 Tax=Melia azedarach TaxID=155640 RepID=A0ACC1XLG3_MELAZ|nr:NAC domain containing protein [Melia azedarach]